MVREQQGDASVVTEVLAGAESSMTATYETVSVNKRRITNCVSLSVHLDAVRSLTISQLNQDIFTSLGWLG